jgi:hypothetical protein
MHDMVTEWRKPVDAAYIVAGLPAFSTLSVITDIIKQGALDGLAKGRFSSSPNYALKADVVSPGGEVHSPTTNTRTYAQHAHALHSRSFLTGGDW